MIRFKLVWVGILAFPTLASAQQPKPPEPTTAPTAEAPPGQAGRPYRDSELIPYAPYSNPSLLAITPPAGDALQAKFGLQLAPADDALRAQLEIPTGRGVVIVGIKPGSLAEHAGLKTNDILVRLGERDVESVNAASQVLLGLGKEALEVKLIREGKARRMSLVGPEHGFPAEAAEYWIGVPVSPVDATLRAHLPSLPEDSGLIVNDVVKDSPADQVSVKKNDILVTMDGKPLKNSDALVAQIQASQGKPVPLQVLRAGKPLTLTITPAKRAHPTVINYRNSPEGRFNFQLVRPNMAIEVEPARRAFQAGQEQTQLKPLEANPLLGWDLVMDRNATYPNIAYTLTNYIPWAPVPLANADPSTAKIEGQLKEVIAKLDEITKALEALKKPVEK